MPKKNIKTDRLVAEQVNEKVFALSDGIRYVAVYHNGKLESISKPNLSQASWWESDRYEELIVNPTLLTLLRQRGLIDCGGMQYVVIQYGNFTQFVHPIKGGHISVAFELTSDYFRLLPGIKKILREHQLIDEE